MKRIGGLALTLAVLAQPGYAQVTPEKQDPLEEIINRSAAPSPTLDLAKVKEVLNNQLVKAVEAGDLTEASYALERGADPKVAKEGQPLIQYAAKDARMVKLLLSKGADRDALVTNIRGQHVALLIDVIERGYAKSAYELVMKGARVDSVDAFDSTPLMLVLERPQWNDEPTDRELRDLFVALVKGGSDLKAQRESGADVLTCAQEAKWLAPVFVEYIAGTLKQPIEEIERKAEEWFRSEEVRKKKEELDARKQAELQKKQEEVARRKKAAIEAAELARLKRLAKQAPLHILGRSIDYNSIGSPEATIRVANLWSKDIDAYRVEFRCFNNFDRVVYGFGLKSAYIGISQDLLESGSTSDDTWTLHGFDNATKFSARIIEVHFTDGTTWRPRR